MSKFIEKEPCDLCGKRPWKRLRTDSNGKTVFFCDKCPAPFSIARSGRINTVFIKGYGNESAARVAEMKRRVILPDAADENGDYVVGRRMENGKISENKSPNY